VLVRDDDDGNSEEVGTTECCWFVTASVQTVVVFWAATG
jgi:hypothetical protein